MPLSWTFVSCPSQWIPGLGGSFRPIADGPFVCADPVRAACRLLALIDGLAVQLTVHDDVMPERGCSSASTMPWAGAGL